VVAAAEAAIWVVEVEEAAVADSRSHLKPIFLLHSANHLQALSPGPRWPGVYSLVGRYIMASQKQIDANRRNAEKSTGPKTPEGKQAVRLNALKHGLRASIAVLPNENAEAFQKLCDDLEAEWQPQTPTEQLLLEDMAVAHWRLLRAETCEDIMMRQDRVDKDHMAFISQLSQMQARQKRAFYQAMHELERVQQKRKPQPHPEADCEPPRAPQPVANWDHQTAGHVYVASAARATSTSSASS
jgi:hypothetical protein